MLFRCFFTGFDGVVRYETLPTDHRQGTRLGFGQDVIATAPGLRVGMLVSSSAIQLYVDGALIEQVTLEEDTNVSWVGLASIANIGCEYDYLWVGPVCPVSAHFQRPMDLLQQPWLKRLS